MGLKCKITTTPTGAKVVTNEDGTVNKLYADALRYTQNEEEALNLWASSYLPEFETSTGKTQANASLEDVVRFYTTPVMERLSNREVFEVREFMKRNGIESLSKLSQVMNSVFKPDGFFEISVPRAVASGLYSQEEAFELEPQNLINVISKIESHLTKEDINIEPETGKVYYKDSANKTIFGSFNKASETEVDQELFENLTKGMTIDQAVNESSFREFSESFFSSQAFRKKVTDRVESLKRVPVVSFLGNKLSTKDNTYYTTLKNTISVNINPAIVEAELEYLLSIDDNIWSAMQPQVKTILKEIERDFVNINVDVIGISELSNDKQGVLDLLAGLSKVVKDPTEVNIQEFATQFSEKVLGVQQDPSTYELLDSVYSKLTIVNLDTNLTDNELFAEHGLIKIGEKLYHKVQRGQVDQMYEYLYDQVLKGNSPVKINSDINNKEAVLKELSIFVNSRNIGLQVENKEEVSLNQLVFEHKPLYKASKNTAVQQLNSITTDRDYLKSRFVEDFYNYILREKLANSEVYRTVLSKFRITDSDISIKGTIDSIDNIEMSTELKDYIRLKREADMDYLLPQPSNTVLDEDTFFQNFPEEAQPFPSDILVEGPFILTNNTAGTYKRLNNMLYKKVIVEGNRQLFVQVDTDNSTTYYNSKTDVKFDAKQAKDFMSAVNFGLDTLTSEKVQEKVDSIKEPFKTSNIQKRDQVRMISKYMEKNLGINVNILTPTQVQEELNKRGYTTNESELTNGSERYNRTGERGVDRVEVPTTIRNVEQVSKDSNRGGGSTSDNEIFGVKDRVEEDFNEARLSGSAFNDRFGFKDIKLFKKDETVYGFYDPTTDQIYLAEDVLNSNTLIHELWHLYKPVVRKAALNGDSSAKVLLNKMDQLVSEGFNEEVFNKRFDNFLGKTESLDFAGNEDFQIVGEQGAQRDEEAYNKLQQAKKMLKDGTDKSIVESVTGWSEYKGQWTYFDVNALKQFKFKNNTFPQVGVETTLGEVLEDNIIFKYYPQLKNIKVEHEYGMDTGTFARTTSEDGAKIWINEARALEAYRGIYLGGIGRTYNEITLEDSIIASYIHEITHVIQGIELLPTGGDPYTVIRKAIDITGSDNYITPKLVKNISDKLEEEIDEDDKKILIAAKVVTEGILSKDPKPAQVMYEMLYGEVEARAVELAYIKLRNNDLEDGIALKDLKEILAKQEGISLEDQLVVRDLKIDVKYQQGISPQADLNSEAYNPRQGESREDYISRMKEELEANLLGANADQFLESFTKEMGMSEKEATSFIEKVKAFIKEFSSWIANQLGFKGMTAQQAEQLTTQDILNRVTTSMLRDDFGKNISNVQSILDSNLIFVDSYSEKENIQDKMNACG